MSAHSIDTTTHDLLTSTPPMPCRTQKNLGGDLSMTFFVKPAVPTKFPSISAQQIKGLNAECIAEVQFPPPNWITQSNYFLLRGPSEGNTLDSAFFSLNIAVYSHLIVPSEWEESWFLMAARVHPYALTWQISPDTSSPDSESMDYTIPLLQVRDHSYQP